MSLENAKIPKELLQDVVKNINYNKVIVEYYEKYHSDFEKNLKLYNDVDYLVGCLMFSVADDASKNKSAAYSQAITGMSKNLNFDLENRDLLNLDDLKYLSDKLKVIISNLKDNLIKTLFNKIESLHDCNKFWQLDKYEIQKIKDFKKTSLCRDKFCANCKKVKQASRMSKYIPELEQYKGNLYHLTLTLPNCSGVDLRPTISKMAKDFRKLIGYICGREKIKDIDFSSWGYQGAVRSLEVTFKNDNYHPHYHVGFVFNSLPELKKDIENTFSWNTKTKSGFPELSRLFSEQEILIQKIWYLLLNGIKVTKVNIDELEEGYSCNLDKFKEDDYAELFKYMTKECDQGGKVLTYQNFVVLYESLYRLKQIQGYGCLYQIAEDGDLEECERQYEEMIQEIRKKESPVAVLEKPQELILDSEYTLVSRKSYFKYLKKL